MGAMLIVSLRRVYARLTALFGKGPVHAFAVSAAFFITLTLALLAWVSATAPTTITITSGPVGSTFERYAERYKTLLEKQGVRVRILPSEGSIQNLQRLQDAKSDVDVGFVLSGEVADNPVQHLWSLGSISYQPLMVFYRGAPKELLSEFKGKRIDIGSVGSGAHELALVLLKENGIEPGGDTVLENSVKGDIAASLLSGRVDAIFVMGDSTTGDIMHKLLHTPDIHLLNFVQASAYARRINYLNKLELPRGTLDFGNNLPPQDVSLVAPAVELIARDTLHPALSDILLDAARSVHGGPGVFKARGQFPAPVEHEIPISPDAARFYASGKSFLYRNFPFRIASILARTLAVLLPMAILLLPALRLAPGIYRWRIESRIRRWYRVLLDLEREAEEHSDSTQRREELLRHLDHIENSVNKIAVPASFGDIFYGLRGHIDYVRAKLWPAVGARSVPGAGPSSSL